MSLTNRQYQPVVLSIDLSTARANVAQGLTSKINTITVISLGGGSLSLRINGTTNSLITLSDNMKIEGTPISEIYWTNSAQGAKTANIYTAWID